MPIEHRFIRLVLSEQSPRRFRRRLPWWRRFSPRPRRR
jgi:hypothetical protein